MTFAFPQKKYLRVCFSSKKRFIDVGRIKMNLGFQPYRAEAQKADRSKYTSALYFWQYTQVKMQAESWRKVQLLQPELH